MVIFQTENKKDNHLSILQILHEGVPQKMTDGGQKEQSTQGSKGMHNDCNNVISDGQPPEGSERFDNGQS